MNGAIQTSDIVDKEAVEDIEKDCLSVVRMLRPKKYRWRNCKRQHRGFIANEITETLERIGMRHDGLIYKDDENRLGMSYSELTPILWKAVQQMADKIEELEKLIGVKK